MTHAVEIKQAEYEMLNAGITRMSKNLMCPVGLYVWTDYDKTFVARQNWLHQPKAPEVRQQVCPIEVRFNRATRTERYFKYV